MKRVVVIFIVFLSTQVFGQVNENLVGKIILPDSNQPEICEVTFAQADSLEFLSYVSEYIEDLQFQGYLEARIDSIRVDSLSISAFTTKGNKYQWASIKTDSITEDWLKKAKVKISKLTNNPVRPHELQPPIQKVLLFLENNGYPFARVSMDNTRIHQNTISSGLKINPGPLIVIDTLYVKGDANLSHGFIKSYLNISRNDIYSQKQANKIDEKLRRLPYLSVIRQAEVEFIPGKARIYTYITNQKASQFSGLVAFASGQEESQRIKLTGDVNLKLVNTFKKGEINTLQWQAMGEGTQRLNLSSKWKYIKGSNIGFSSNFALYRLDTTFLNINPKFTVDFFINNRSSLGLGIDYRASSTLGSQQSSSISNYKTTLYQLNYTFGQQGPEVFPIRNLFTRVTAGIGTRDLDQESNHEVSKVSTVGEVRINASVYHPFFGHSMVFHISLNAEMLEPISSTKDHFVYIDNELYRIGGANSLRGFNQEAILAKAYGIASFELQYRLQRTLNLFVFFDKAAVNTIKTQTSNMFWPQGAGLGFQLATGGGILNLNYALGSGMGQNFSLPDAKVHVGYIANF